MKSRFWIYLVSMTSRYNNVQFFSHLLMLAGIIAIAFVMRFFSYLMDSTVARDSILYINMAESWYKFEDYYGMLTEFSTWGGIPIFPLWLMKSLMGLGISGEAAGISMVIIMGSLLPLVIYKIAFLVCANKEVALGAALLTAVHPALIEMSIQIMRDTPYLFWVGVSIWFLLNAIKYQKKRYWLGGGMILALSILTRYESFEILLLVFGYLLAAPFFQWIKWRKAIMFLICFLSSLMLTICLLQLVAGISPGHSISHSYYYIYHAFHKFCSIKN